MDLFQKYILKYMKDDGIDWENVNGFVDWPAYDNGNLFVNVVFSVDSKQKCKLYHIKDNECKEVKIKINEEIAYMRSLGAIEGNRLMYRINSKFYIIDYEGNVLEERLLIDDEIFNTLGAYRMRVSYDGKKILYELGKNPIDLNIYDLETGKTRVLCPGGYNDGEYGDKDTFELYGLSYINLWSGNNTVIVVIELYDKESGNQTIVAKAFESD
ncbi:hypothetical protein [Acetivibrio clariflavus]|nr:hypothetical protein [Acetivibrio clariflavus]